MILVLSYEANQTYWNFQRTRWWIILWKITAGEFNVYWLRRLIVAKRVKRFGFIDLRHVKHTSRRYFISCLNRTFKYREWGLNVYTQSRAATVVRNYIIRLELTGGVRLKRGTRTICKVIREESTRNIGGTKRSCWPRSCSRGEKYGLYPSLFLTAAHLSYILPLLSRITA